MFMDSYRKSAHSMLGVLFRIEGDIICAVLPFCIVNCLLLALVAYYRTEREIGFSATGHGLLTLLVSFLVISKVNLAYDRFRVVRKHAAVAFMVLRELVQMVISISSSDSPRDKENELTKQLQFWRMDCVDKVSDLMDITVKVLKDKHLACYFARDTPVENWRSKGEEDEDPPNMSVMDPMVHVQGLRMHLYCTSDLDIHLLERVNLVNKLQEFVGSYNNLLILASTPLPYPLVKMGRVFLFLWTFSMPLVLLGGPFSDLLGAQIFLFFLTYGFIGLELVSMKLSDPFGNSRDDVQISRIKDAALLGIENDLKQVEIETTVSDRRYQFSRQKDFKRDLASDRAMTHGQRMGCDHQNYDGGHHYHAMGGSDNDMGC
jgi:predicted membrane chloride channel (bestrophin family)